MFPVIVRSRPRVYDNSLAKFARRMPPCRTAHLALLVAFLGQPGVEAGVITFDETGAPIGATDGATIGTAYQASQGVEFVNAIWRDPIVGLVTEPLGLNALNTQDLDPGAPVLTFSSVMDQDHAIIINFDTAVDFVSIVAVDVGQAGARLDAYTNSGGTGTPTTSQAVGTGFGPDNFTLSVSLTGVLRIELYQPFDPEVSPGSFDGVVFDNLQFSSSSQAVPEPSSLLLAGVGAAVLCCRIRKPRRRRQRCGARSTRPGTA